MRSSSLYKIKYISLASEHRFATGFLHGGKMLSLLNEKKKTDFFLGRSSEKD